MERMRSEKREPARAGLGLGPAAAAALVAVLALVALVGCAAGDTNFTNVVTTGYVTTGGNATIGGDATVAGTLGVTGETSLAAVTSKAKVTTKTAAYTVTVAETGVVFNNIGAGGAVTFTLPTAAAGLQYCFATVAAQQIAVDPASTNAILALTNAGGDKITNSTAGNSVCLVGVSATQWVARDVYGTWADAN